MIPPATCTNDTLFDSDTTTLSYEWLLNGVVISTEEAPDNLAPGSYLLFVAGPEGCMTKYGPFEVDRPIAVSLEPLEAGVYFLKLKIGSRWLIQKVIKSKSGF